MVGTGIAGSILAAESGGNLGFGQQSNATAGGNSNSTILPQPSGLMG
jgi:tetratricopeptide (TPR) repeat protein